jgi:hypothetical protein
MTAIPNQRQPQPRPTPVRRLMTKHALPEPIARVLVLLAYGDGTNG